MRIAMVTDTYTPQINGVVTSILLTRRELERRGHEVVVLAPDYDGRERPEHGVWRYRSVPFPTRVARENRIISRIPLGACFDWRRAGIDVIHSHVPATMGSHAIFWADLHDIPHVHTYHTHWIEYVHYAQFAPGFFRRAVKWRARTFCNRCTRIVAPSGAILQALRSYGVQVPIDVVPTGIDLPPLSQLASPERTREALGIPPERKLLSFVGRIAAEKQVAYLMPVHARIAAEGLDVHLVVVGDGPGRPDLEHEVDRLGLRDRVSFTGYVPRERTFDYTSASDLFVFSSQTETQGISLLEAMSVGTPVVAVAALGVAELMSDGRGGLTAAPGDMDGFVACVRRMLGEPGVREAASRQAREKARDTGITFTIERLLACYADAIAGHRAGA